MKPKTIQLIFNISIVAGIICSSFLIYNTFCPNLPKVYHTCIVFEFILSIIIIVLALTKKKWDKHDSDQVEK